MGGLGNGKVMVSRRLRQEAQDWGQNQRHHEKAVNYYFKKWEIVGAFRFWINGAGNKEGREEKKNDGNGRSWGIAPDPDLAGDDFVAIKKFKNRLRKAGGDDNSHINGNQSSDRFLALEQKTIGDANEKKQPDKDIHTGKLVH